MKKCLLLLLLAPISSCERDDISSPREDWQEHHGPIALGRVGNQTIAMNSQFGPLRIPLQRGGAPRDGLSFSMTSSDWSLADSGSLFLESHPDFVMMTIMPILGRSGQSRISLIARSGETSDSVSFMLTVARSPSNSPYPTTLRKLSQSEFDARQNQLTLKLGAQYTARLDQFGLLDHLGTLSRGKSSITIPDQAVSVVKFALQQLSSFTNISDTSTLVLESATNYTGSPSFTDWVIIFKNQIYKGIEVWDTRIITLVSDNLVSLDWHHYNDVFVPRDDIVSRERAQKAIVGNVISFYCWSPGRFTITNSSIMTAGMVYNIVPLVKNDSLEFHLAWRIPISPAGGSPYWYYFVDVLTGEVILVRQLFIC
jgi:hypothetical protein